eukprot:NODE_86_length_22075_cov_1.190253.p8 type:complete len:357 gc:universal NODE_86_length_22075_cov_1.190253:7321-8391(+)
MLSIVKRQLARSFVRPQNSTLLFLRRFNSTESKIPSSRAPDEIPQQINSHIAETGSIPTQSSIIEQNEEMISNAFLQQMPQTVGDLHSLGLSYSWPPGWIVQFLEAFYITSGLSWWAAIVLYTLTIRILLVPTIVKMMKVNAKLMKIQPQVQLVQKKLEDAKQNQDVPLMQKSINEMKSLYSEQKISPLSALKGPIIQGAILISTFVALRRMATLPVPSFETGGALWFTDLTAADPTLALPIISAISVLALLKYSSEIQPPTPQTQTLKTLMPFLVIGGAYFVSDFPAAVFVYWITSNVFSILQTLLLQSPKMRKKFGIPKIEKPVLPKSHTKPLGFFEGFKLAYEANRKPTNSNK